MPITKKQKDKLKALGEKVKNVRKQKGFTLKELAHSIDKDPQSIHRLEMGGINPSYLYLLQLCEGLQIEITELVDDLNK
jgi:transcriptional regulator with XRE-family HTH domain